MMIQSIFVGTSAGGVGAIQKFLQLLPRNFSLPIVFVQHLPSDAIVDPKLIFSQNYKGEISEIIDKQPMEQNHVYFAPPGYHLSIERDLTFSLSQEDPVNYARPSIDIFFESVASSLGARACAVLMTGANSDGAEGIKAVQESGGYAIVQDPESAEAPMMPKSAIAIMKPDFVGTIEDIAGKVSSFSEISAK